MIHWWWLIVAFAAGFTAWWACVMVYMILLDRRID